MRVPPDHIALVTAVNRVVAAPAEQIVVHAFLSPHHPTFVVRVPLVMFLGGQPVWLASASAVPAQASRAQLKMRAAGRACVLGLAVHLPVVSRQNHPIRHRASVDGRSGSAAGHRREDHERVGVADRRIQPVQHAHVLVVEVDVHVPVQRAVGAEQLILGGRVIGREVAEDLADVRAVGLPPASRCPPLAAQDRGES